jgi:predicted membrane-bound spermidine synthase
MPLGLEIKSIAAALLLFAPASVLLGFVTPYAVKIKITTIDEAGITVGRLYALSTIGSILGTFLAGFVLIPFVGSEKTLYLIGASLIGLSILLAPFALTKFNMPFSFYSFWQSASMNLNFIICGRNTIFTILIPSIAACRFLTPSNRKASGKSAL